MLAILGFLTVIIMLILVMTKKASPTVALIGVPVVIGAIASLFADYSVLDIGGFISSGIGTVAATGVMFIFSILFFGILTDAGTFRPIIHKILSIIGVDPVKIALGTAILAMIVHLDGSGAVTFLICIPALLPVYDAVGMKKTTLATIVALAAGTMNVVPWGGPTIRAATAVEMNVMDLFSPVLIPLLFGLATVLVFAFILGNNEKKRLGITKVNVGKVELQELTEEQEALLRPHLFIVNVGLILLAIVGLIVGGKYGIKPEVVFMISFVLSMVINYPNVSTQKARVDAHAKSAILMASVLFAAGAFTGIMKGSGMITAMSESLVAIIPDSIAKYFAVITGIISMPASLLFDPDSFYFGVLPVLSSTAGKFGVDVASIARAAILGQMTTGFPVSPLTPATFLLVGLAGVDFGEHQKKTIPYAFIVTIVMLIVSIAVGAIII